MVEEEDLVDWRAVSVQFLVELKKRLQEYQVCRRTHIFRVLENMDSRFDTDSATLDLVEGETIKGIKRAGPRWFGYKKSGRSGWFVSQQVKEIRRVDWTLQDVFDYALHEDHERSPDVFKAMDESRCDETFAGVLLITSWKMKFSKLVEMLETKFKGKDLSSHYVWLDMCSIDYVMANKGQFSCKDVMRRIVSNGLHDAIANFDEVLICLGNDHNPYAIDDKWILWSIFMMATIKREDTEENTSLSFVLPPYERICLFKDLTADFEHTMNTFLNDADMGNCFQGPGGKFIDDEMKRGRINYRKLNKFIRPLLEKSFRQFAFEAIWDEEANQKEGWQRRIMMTRFSLCKHLIASEEMEAFEKNYKNLVHLAGDAEIDTSVIPDVVTFLSGDVDRTRFDEEMKKLGQQESDFLLREKYEEIRAKKRAAAKAERLQRYGPPKRIASRTTHMRRNRGSEPIFIPK